MISKVGSWTILSPYFAIRHMFFFFLFFLFIQRVHIIAILSYTCLLCFLRLLNFFSFFLVLRETRLCMNFLSTLVESWDEQRSSFIFTLEALFIVMTSELIKFFNQQSLVLIRFWVFVFFDLERETFFLFIVFFVFN